MKKSSRIVYLQTSAAILQERLARSRKRPLLERHDREKVIEEMHTSRLPQYEAAADITINAGNRPFSAIVDEIIQKTEYR
ncbi:MAG: hypothetical protein E4H31_03410 [Dehalococcoidia bacterium]|nr:MAG: hypothetical protein E4H31_03410 [Dehalococcoidia bacterium]